jgi:cyclopropane fatty-acyl-phospholipid synthase-like methyltransferase
MFHKGEKMESYIREIIHDVYGIGLTDEQVMLIQEKIENIGCEGDRFEIQEIFESIF